MNYVYFFILIFLLTITSCKTLNSHISYQELMLQRSAEAKSLEKKSDSTNCKANSYTKLPGLILKNNLWGKSRIKKGEAHLCTFQKEEGVGWKWQVPENAKGVIGYPAVQVGPGPWSNAKEEVHGFPIQLEAIKELSVDYETEIYVKHKKYNLAFDLWLSSEFQSNKSTITTEIMIWEDAFDFKSYGKKVDEIYTSFGTYDVMKGYLKNDEFGQNWHYFAFIRQGNRKKGNVDLQFFLQYLIKNHAVNPHNFLTSVEFGNEIGNSSGFTMVKKFELHLD